MDMAHGQNANGRDYRKFLRDRNKKVTAKKGGLCAYRSKKCRVERKAERRGQQHGAIEKISKEAVQRSDN